MPATRTQDACVPFIAAHVVSEISLAPYCFS
jgi:hypothetical protein